MTKEDCKDCFMLVEGDNGEWCCGSRCNDNIEIFNECPEEDNQR